MFPSGQGDTGTSNNERVSSSNSPSVGEDGDLDVDRSKSDSNDDLAGSEPPIQSVIGLDGFK